MAWPKKKKPPILAPHQFRIGDKVRRTVPGGSYAVGHQFYIKDFISNDNANESTRGFVVDFDDGLHNPNYLELVKGEWRPEPGELVQTGHRSMIGKPPEPSEEISWSHQPKEFIQMINGRYLCKCNQNPDDHNYSAYAYVRPRQTYQITLENGQTVNISRESYMELCKGVR